MGNILYKPKAEVEKEKEKARKEGKLNGKKRQLDNMKKIYVDHLIHDKEQAAEELKTKYLEVEEEIEQLEKELAQVELMKYIRLRQMYLEGEDT